MAALVVLTLALGIGGSTTMYGLLRAVAWFGQPTVPEPERVARLFTTFTHQSDGRGLVSFDDFHRWKETARSFEALAAYTGRAMALGTNEGVDDVSVLSVTPSYLSLLKTPPVVGRVFSEEEIRASGGLSAVLSELAWRSRFGGDPAILGRTLDLDGKRYTVIGVMEQRLGLIMGRPEVFIPLVDEDVGAAVMVIGRRRGSVSWEQARSELSAIGLSRNRLKLKIRVVPILDDVRYRTRMGWLVFVGPPFLVLLIGCGNIACLLLVRAVRREREMAVRLALGAMRRRLAWQLLVEGWILAMVGGSLGVVFAILGMRGIEAMIPVTIEARSAMDAGTLVFAGVATLLTPLVFGVAPILHGLRVNLTDALRGGLNKPLFGVGRYHLRDVFAILEVGLSVALAMLTFMLLSLFAAVRALEFNFDDRGLIVARISPREGGAEIKDRDIAEGLARRLRVRIAAIPGVSDVTIGNPPLENAGLRVGRLPNAAEAPASCVRIDPAYFATLRLPIKIGRDIGDEDARGAGFAAVVSESLATSLWPGKNPLGRHLHMSGAGHSETVTVVGVSKDAVRLGRLEQLDDPRLIGLRNVLYRPRSQKAATRFDVIARVRGKSASFHDSIRQAVDAVDGRLRLRKIESMTSTLHRVGDPRDASIMLYLLGGFGCLALLLAAIGVFGVMSQLVDERRAELGIRLALGAPSRGIARLVVRDGMIRVGLGAILAMIGVFLSIRFGFPGLLGLSAVDPWFWIAIVVVVAVAAAAACYVPARRAARIDPVTALRCD
jgi:putative ABC transport system permease protein